VIESREDPESEEEERQMEWKTTWEDPLTSYLQSFAGLIGDQRTQKTFGETVKGILTAGSLICQQIATGSAELSKGKKGSQRVIRLATGAWPATLGARCGASDEALAGGGGPAVRAGARRGTVADRR
jgi:hypothetical protein